MDTNHIQERNKNGKTIKIWQDPTRNKRRKKAKAARKARKKARK